MTPDMMIAAASLTRAELSRDLQRFYDAGIDAVDFSEPVALLVHRLVPPTTVEEMMAFECGKVAADLGIRSNTDA